MGKTLPLPRGAGRGSGEAADLNDWVPRRLWGTWA